MSGAQYKCFVADCDKLFSYESSLKKHVQNIHPDEFETDVKTGKVKLSDCILLRGIGLDSNISVHDSQQDVSISQ